MSRARVAGSLCFAVAALLHVAARGSAQPAALLLADIAPAPGAQGSGLSDDLVVFGGVAYFAGRSETTGRELWRSDGSAAGTRLVADLCPGPCDSSPGRWAVDAGTLWFTARHPATGFELWRTDGTAAGTRVAVEVLPGPEDGVFDILAATPVGLFLSAHDGLSGRELWISDGTAAGTQLLADIAPGSASSDLQGNDVAWAGGRLFFAADDGVAGRELWASDGTPAGTAMVADSVPGSGGLSPDFLETIGAQVVFRGFEAATGGELWVSDGTEAGTQLLRDLRPGAPGSFPQQMTASGPFVYFGASNGSDYDLWRTDGTFAGTVLVHSISPQDPVDWNGIVYFQGSSPFGLWRSDGTGGGTFLVGGSNNVQGIRPAGGRLYFKSDGGGGGFELWTSDGTGGGTYRVTDLCPGGCGSYPEEFVDLGGGVALFSAEGSTDDRELWRSSGTAGTTSLVADVHAPTRGSAPGPFVADATRLFFPAGASVVPFGGGGPLVDRELWATDGTPGATALVADLRPGDEGSRPEALAAGAAGVLFFADDGATGAEPWTSDGTGAGTVGVDDVCAGGCSSAYYQPEPPVPFDGGWFFTAADDGSDYELWRTDGTPAGTVEVADLSTAGDGSRPRDFAVAGGLLFFAATDDAGALEAAPPARFGEPTVANRDVELWVSDGSGATRVADLEPGPEGSHPTELTPFGSGVLFRATDSAAGRELWISQGTAPTTTRVADIAAGAAPSGPAGFVVIAGPVALFAATDAVAGRELWRTDGTPAGTTRVVDLRPGSAGSEPRDLVAIGDVVYFSAEDGTSGRELWRSDGSAAGTWRVADIAPGAVGSDPRGLAVEGEALLFAAADGSSGIEPWASDGVEAARIADLAPGAAGSHPSGFAALPAAPGAVAAADDGASGPEPWLFRLPDLEVAISDAPDPVVEGGTLAYEVTIDNIGAVDADAVTLVVELPAGVTFVGSAPPSPACVYQAGAHELECALGALAPAASAVVELDVAVGMTGATTLDAPATVDPGGRIDRRISDNVAAAATSVLATLIFADGFETGDVSQWSTAVP